MTELAPAFTDDRLLDGRVTVRQPAAGYRVAIDPVLLAAAVPAAAGARVLDAGCGTGAAMFCLAARVPGVVLTGLELQPALADYARAGLVLNGLAADGTGAAARVATGDLAVPPGEVLDRRPFDVVMTNPPFTADGTPPPDGSRAAAHHEGAAGLAGWIGGCLAMLRPKGRLVMIHRADRLSEILAHLAGRAGDARILPIHAKADQPARRVIVDAGKGRRSPDTLLPGLVLHGDGGAFTAAADAVLRGARALR